ncbi:MAG: HEAT repeat protein [Myxococcota bacterium]|jgi:HEAT repeat protein
MRVPLASLLILLSVSLPAMAGELRDQVLEQLSGVEDPPSAAALMALGDGVDAVLIELAQDDSLPRTHRGRAVHALGDFPTESGRTLLVTTLNADDSYLARKAVYALGRGWGESALPELSQALSSDDLRLREAAVHAMAPIDAAPVRAVLSERLAVETEPTVQDALTAALAQ